jgi:hypothetical protein
MKCPHCNGSVSSLNPSVGGLRLRGQKCPHCGASVRIRVGHKRTLLLVLGVALIVALITPALSHLYGHLLLIAAATVMALVGILALTTMELLSGEP